MSHSNSHSPTSSSSAPLLSGTRSPSPCTDHLDPTYVHAHVHGDIDIDIDDNSTDLEAASLTSSPSLQPPPPPYREKLSSLSNRHSNKQQSRRRRASTSPLRAIITRRPRVLAAACVLLFLLVFAVFAVVHVSRGGRLSTVPEANVDVDKENEGMYPAQVRGAPTESFWDNLRDDTQYITSWINAGWTNDFMTYVNLLYLAVLTNRTAVLPAFAPSHLGSSAGFINVGDVFDLPRLSASIGVPVIQWSDLKLPESDHVDELGCWSIWATVAVGEHEKKPRFNIIEPMLELDVSYTPVPASTILLPRPQFSNDPHTRFSSLAALTFPDGRQRAHLPSSAPFPGSSSGHTTLPDERMACFDFPYYVSSEATFEFNYDWSPAWRFVGTHAHWTPWMRGVAFDAIRRTFGLGEREEIPPFISLHVRHGDFGRYCQSQSSNSSSSSSCFAPLSTYASYVSEIRQELLEREGIDVTRVLVTSDESDAGWWEEVRALGWEWVDHEGLGTEERFGKWYTVFIDAVIQSLGVGFVGTDKSTMSLIAQRRVEDWNHPRDDGWKGAGWATREVRWGPWDESGH